MSGVMPGSGPLLDELPLYDSANQLPAWRLEILDLWRYRDLVAQLVARDIKVRYKRSIVGVAWTMLNPLLMTVIYTIAFSHIFHVDAANYPVFLLSGTLAWGFFAQTTSQAMSLLMSSGSFMTRIFIPRTIFAVSALLVGLINFVLALIPLFLIMAATGVPFGPSLLWLPVSIILLSAFTLGVSLLLSTIAVQFYDVIEMYGVLLTAWFFWTPIVYPAHLVPEGQAWRLMTNPMFHLVELFRAPIYDARPPDMVSFAAASLIAVGTLLVGWVVYTYNSDRLAYHL